MSRSDALYAGTISPFAPAIAREDWPVLVALPAVCAVLAMAIPTLGWWVLLLAIVVYGVGFRAFGKARTVDDTYDELIVALSRLGEMNGAVVPGHAARSAELSGMMGARLGLGPQQLATVRAAALVRTAGMVGGDEPPWMRPGVDHRTFSRWTASIIGHDGPLSEVARLVGPEDVGALGNIVEIAATYDDAVYGMGMAPAAACALVSRDTPPSDAAITAALAAVLVDDGVVLRASVLHGGPAFAMDAMAE